MSAYIVSRAHINALLRVGLEGPAVNRQAMHTIYWYTGDDRHSLDHETADRVGQMLTDANVKSVRTRYPDADEDGGLPGTYITWLTGHTADDGSRLEDQAGDWTNPYTYPATGVRRLTAVEALKALSGYDYQACEADDWEQSEAHAFTEALRDTLIGMVPGYEEADTWEVTA